MRTERITLEDLEAIAFRTGIPAYVDTARNVAYLRRGRVRYEAPLRPIEVPPTA